MRFQTALADENPNGIRHLFPSGIEEWTWARREAEWNKRLWRQERRNICPVCGQTIGADWRGSGPEGEWLCFDCTIWLLANIEVWDEHAEFEEAARLLRDTPLRIPPSNILLDRCLWND